MTWLVVSALLHQCKVWYGLMSHLMDGNSPMSSFCHERVGQQPANSMIWSHWAVGLQPTCTHEQNMIGPGIVFTGLPNHISMLISGWQACEKKSMSIPNRVKWPVVPPILSWSWQKLWWWNQVVRGEKRNPTKTQAQSSHPSRESQTSDYHAQIKMWHDYQTV